MTHGYSSYKQDLADIGRLYFEGLPPEEIVGFVPQFRHYFWLPDMPEKLLNRFCLSVAHSLEQLYGIPEHRRLNDRVDLDRMMGGSVECFRKDWIRKWDPRIRNREEMIAAAAQIHHLWSVKSRFFAAPGAGLALMKELSLRDVRSGEAFLFSAEEWIAACGGKGAGCVETMMDLLLDSSRWGALPPFRLRVRPGTIFSACADALERDGTVRLFDTENGKSRKDALVRSIITFAKKGEIWGTIDEMNQSLQTTSSENGVTSLIPVEALRDALVSFIKPKDTAGWPPTGVLVDVGALIRLPNIADIMCQCHNPSIMESIIRLVDAYCLSYLYDPPGPAGLAEDMEKVSGLILADRRLFDILREMMMDGDRAEMACRVVPEAAKAAATSISASADVFSDSLPDYPERM